MPDVLTGEEEIEVIEAIQAFKNAQARLDEQDPTEALQIKGLQDRIDMLIKTIEDEIPTPLKCPCNHPSLLPPLKCEFGHVLDKDGYSTEPGDEPMYIPSGEEQ